MSHSCLKQNNKNGMEREKFVLVVWGFGECIGLFCVSLPPPPRVMRIEGMPAKPCPQNRACKTVPAKPCLQNRACNEGQDRFIWNIVNRTTYLTIKFLVITIRVWLCTIIISLAFPHYRVRLSASRASILLLVFAPAVKTNVLAARTHFSDVSTIFNANDAVMITVETHSRRCVQCTVCAVFFAPLDEMIFTSCADGWIPDDLQLVCDDSLHLLDVSKNIQSIQGQRVPVPPVFTNKHINIHQTIPIQMTTTGRVTLDDL